MVVLVLKMILVVLFFSAYILDELIVFGQFVDCICCGILRESSLRQKVLGCCDWVIHHTFLARQALQEGEVVRDGDCTVGALELVHFELVVALGLGV